MRLLTEWEDASEQERYLLLECREVVRAIETAAEVILFGSRARGDATGQSDYDILVLVNELTVGLERAICQALYALWNVLRILYLACRYTNVSSGLHA